MNTVKSVFTLIGITIAVIIMLALLGVVDTASWFAGRTVDVVKQQVDPAELLRKYELFKDQSATLDAKLASIKIKEKQVNEIKALPKGELDRTNREQLMIWEQELGGMKYSYNQLASEYNSNMAKINYAFTNVGDLPRGATTPLPRAYKPYQED